MPTTIKPVEPAQNEFLAELEKQSGPVNLFLRTMANRPEMVKAFVPFYSAVVGRGTVERRVKELVYLTVSYANHCAYCTAAHVATAPRAGITPEELQALRTGEDQSFTESERAAIRYARELTRTADAAGTRDALHAHYSAEQIVEITMVAAMANFTNRFNNGLQLEPEG